MRGHVLKTFVEQESPDEGACFRWMLNPAIAKRGGVCKLYDEPESPNVAACWRHMMYRSRIC